MKTNTNISNSLLKYSSEIGLTIMAMATMLGIVDIPEHTYKAVPVTLQTSKYSTFNQNYQNSNPLRREKEENATEYVSYGEVERTPSRSGKY
jgi:hypothetical protein